MGSGSTTTGRTWGRTLLGCVVPLLLAVAGCSAAAGPAAPPAPPAPTAGAGPTAPSSDSTHQAMAPPATPQDAALQLESLLGQHSVLAADMMRGRIRNDEDFGQAATAAIGRNTDDLTQLVSGLFGAPAADKFRTIWAAHVTALFTYSRGLATNDAAARDEARTSLAAFDNDLAEFFSSASQGRLPVATARTALTTHVEHLLSQADAYQAKDYARANAEYRSGYSHTFELGHALASTLLPPDQAAALDEPQWQLRAALSRQLGEHVALAVSALRAGATDGPDFQAAADALNGNTSDLTAAVGSLFGSAAGTQFMTLWADHIDQLVAYTAGVAGKDEARRAAAEAALRDVERRLADFLNTAGNGQLGAAQLAQGLLAHDDTLLRQVDAFVAKDYTQSTDLSYRAYQDMTAMAWQLSDAFGATVAAKMPAGGAQTGAGGTAPGRR